MSKKHRSLVILTQAALIVVLASSRLKADVGTCGGATTTVPFTDVSGSLFFCQIAEAYFSGLTNGTSATTYSPSANVPREQMAAFITRTQDSALRRGSRRAALRQFWSTTPNYATANGGLGTTPVGDGPDLVVSDGLDVWVANVNSATVSRVRGSDGKLLDTWTNAFGAAAPVAAMGKVFVTGRTNPGMLYMIDPAGSAGPVTEVSGSSLGNAPNGIAFDGRRIWTANAGGSGSVSVITPAITTPWPVTSVNISTGSSSPTGILFDGSNIWVTDAMTNTLVKLDGGGGVLQTINVGARPQYPVYDGTNIWVPNLSDSSLSVVRATTGAVIATLTANGLNGPVQAAFDGQRILITNFGGNSVSLWKAADLTPMGTFPTGPGSTPFGACSDGLYFWITLEFAGQLARF
jgi:hypothetical protein